MKKIISFSAMLIGMMMLAMTFTSCEGVEGLNESPLALTKIEKPGLDASYGIHKYSDRPNARIVRYFGDKASMAFVGDKVEYNFTEYAEWSDGKVEPGPVRKESFSLLTQGVEKTTVFTADRKFATRLFSRSTNKRTEVKNAWSANLSDTTYVWRAENGLNELFGHESVAGAGYTVTYQSNGYGSLNYKVEFPPVTWQTAEETTYGQVEAQEIEGKKYDTQSYYSTSAFTFILPDGYAKGDSRKTVKVTNERLLATLIDQMRKALEDQEYVGRFAAAGASVTTTDQHNTYKVVEYNYNDKVAEKGFRRDLDLRAQGASRGDVAITKAERGLKPQLVKLEPGAISIKHSNEDENGFVKRTTEKPYTITLSDGAVIDVTSAYDKDTHEGRIDTLDHTSIREIRLMSTATPVKNASLSTQTKEVYDAVATIGIVVDRTTDGIKTKADTDEVLTITVPYHQTYAVADEKLSERFVPSVENGKPTVRKYETWSLGGEKLVSTESFDPYAVVTATAGNDVYAESANFTTQANGNTGVSTANSSKGNFTASRESGIYTSTMTNGVKSETNRFSYSFDKAITYRNGNYSYTFNGVMPLTESTAQIISAGSKTVGSDLYDVYKYQTTVSGNYSIDNVAIANPSDKVSRDILVKRADEKISERFVPSVENGKPTVRKYETWSRSGEKLVSTESFTPTAAIKARSANDVYAENTAFSTRSNGLSNVTKTNANQGNFVATLAQGVFTSTMSNGAVNGTNEFDVQYNNSIVYQNGNYSYTFPIGWTLSETTAPITSAGKKGDYDTYNYQTTLSASYTIDNVAIAKPSDKVYRKILVKKAEEPKPPVIDPNTPWGKITGMTVTAVPALAAGNGKYADGGGTRMAHKCFDLHTATGTVTVVLPMEEEITLQKVLSGDFWGGNYSQYNSARYVGGRWEPALAKDESDGIRYYINGAPVRFVRNEDLAQWQWSNKHNGSYSTIVDGYKFVLDNNVLTIYHGNKIVLQLKG